MLYSYNWLQEYFDQKLPPAEDLANLITLHIAEVESLQKVDENLENIYLGKILSIKKHPQADRLWLTKVSLGEVGEFNIVCGGINLRKGMLAAVAVPGAKVKWHNEGDLIEIKKSKIRGEVSEGMICAPNEIGLEKLFPEYQEKEILDLSSIVLEPKVGDLISSVLGINDVLIEVENKNITNRPDLWSYLGLAREIGAILNWPIKEKKKLEVISTNKIYQGVNQENKFKVQIINKNSCLSYSLFYLTNFKISLSPFWLRKKVFLTGHHPINNLVDFTNYILFEFGQPMHAFDVEKINGSTILIRSARNNEKIEALNGKEYSLLNDDLVISDQQKSLAVAGIIGGVNSAVSEKTKDVVLEVANFNPIKIRQTSQRLQLSTDSSKLFERKINPLWTNQIIDSLPNILMNIFPECDIDLIYSESQQTKKTKIDFDFSQVSEIVGSEINNSQKILERLGFAIQDNKIVVPSWRSDISIKEDIIEEIIKINGLDKINFVLPRIILRDNNNANQVFPQNALFIREIKKFFTLALGMDEILNYSFLSSEQIKILDLVEKNLIKIRNPLSKNQIALRNSLIPGLLLNLQKNQYYFKQMNIFEVGSTYFSQIGNILAKPRSKEFLPKQEIMLSGVSTDENKDSSELFFELKGKVETFLNHWQIESSFKNSSYSFFDQCLSVKDFGFIGAIKPEIKYHLKINFPIIAFEFNIDRIIKAANKEIKYIPLRKFNLISRDLKIALNNEISYNDLVSQILAQNSKILKVELISASGNFLIIRLFLGSDKKNITDKNVNKIIEEVKSSLNL